MKKPLFSVIIPIYNTEKYLICCLESILNQNFNDFELILVDDGSTDNSSKICDNYAEKYLKIKVIHKQNEGVVFSRQAGVKIANGKYIVCIDADDWIDSNYLKRFADVILKYKVDIVCCGAIWAYENKNLPKRISFCKSGYYNKEKIEKEIFPILIERADGAYFSPTIWAKAFKKNIYLKKELVVNAPIKIGEDHAFVKPCIYYANSIYLIEDCLYYYRQNPYSMTKNKKAFEWNGPRLITKHFEKSIPVYKYDFQNQIYRNLVHNLFNVAVSQFNRKEKYFIIKKDICYNISKPYYKNAIKKCKYNIGGWKGLIAKFCLKNRLIFVMLLYNKFK